MKWPAHRWQGGFAQHARFAQQGSLSPPAAVDLRRHAHNGPIVHDKEFNNDGVNNGIFSAHPGGAQAVICDGSVRFLSENLELRTLKLLATRDDGQVLGEL